MVLNLKNDIEDNEKILQLSKSKFDFILQKFSETKTIPSLSEVALIELLLKREKLFAENCVYIKERNNYYSLLLWTT